jgi:hypothetical protein
VQDGSGADARPARACRGMSKFQLLLALAALVATVFYLAETF